MLVAKQRALTHDILTARAETAAFEPATAIEGAQRFEAELEAAFAAEDWPTAVPLAQAWVAAKQQLPDRGVLRWRRDAMLAKALTGAGRLAEAEAVLAPTPLDCQPCVMARGRLAEAKGHPALADHWFAEGVRIAPSWAAPHEEYGRVLLARGDIAAALRHAEASLKIGPRFADAMELAGEAAMARGDAKAAAARFAAAETLTPRWGRLHLKHGEALAKLGKADQARQQFRIAAALYLTPPERAELQRLNR